MRLISRGKRTLMHLVNVLDYFQIQHYTGKYVKRAISKVPIAENRIAAFV